MTIHALSHVGDHITINPAIPYSVNGMMDSLRTIEASRGADPFAEARYVLGANHIPFSIKEQATQS